jgi:hypothetical protein
MYLPSSGLSYALLDAPQITLTESGVNRQTCEHAASAVVAMALRESEMRVHSRSRNHGYGFVTHFKIPGGFKVQLYELKYSK